MSWAVFSRWVRQSLPFGCGHKQQTGWGPQGEGRARKVVPGSALSKRTEQRVVPRPERARKVVTGSALSKRTAAESVSKQGVHSSPHRQSSGQRRRVPSVPRGTNRRLGATAPAHGGCAAERQERQIVWQSCSPGRQPRERTGETGDHGKALADLGCNSVLQQCW